MAVTEDSPGSIAAYQPRAQFLPFHLRDLRWAIIVAHRRAGKTVACVVELLTRALATSKPDARYAYIAPFREQAKTAAWNYLKHYALPVVHDPAKDFRESELAVRLANGSQVRLFGADNPNALRGMYLDGVVMDEYADMRPALWGEVIRPALSDRKGWAVFIGTPRGKNAFYRLYEGADAEWFRMTLRASDTGILPPEELAAARRQMTEAQYEQEYECSFEAAILGAIYAKELKAAESRIKAVPYDASRLVHTAWDIGVGDPTAIWFWQEVGREIRVLDYYESSGERVTHYLSVLRSKGYSYDTCWLPHDARNQQMTGGTVAEAIQGAGFRVGVLPRLSLEDGINAARTLFTRVWFDREKCAPGLEALGAYQWSYNARMDELKPTPVHNWASHGADAFRYLAHATQAAKNEQDIHGLEDIRYPAARVV
ncbi:MAG TPA: terminase family protein [Chthonomonadales bacterium]|nr:terminase family protein [Chthonomonadales bacterium]